MAFNLQSKYNLSKRYAQTAAIEEDQMVEPQASGQANQKVQQTSQPQQPKQQPVEEAPMEESPVVPQINPLQFKSKLMNIIKTKDAEQLFSYLRGNRQLFEMVLYFLEDVLLSNQSTSIWSGFANRQRQKQQEMRDLG